MVGIYEITDIKKCQQDLEKLEDSKPSEYVDFQPNVKLSVLPDDNIVFDATLSVKSKPKYTEWVNDGVEKYGGWTVDKSGMPKTFDASARINTGCVPFVLYFSGYIDIDVDKINVPKNIVVNELNIPIDDNYRTIPAGISEDISKVISTDGGKTVRFIDPTGKLPSACQLKRVSTNVPKTCSAQSAVDVSVIVDGKRINLEEELKKEAFKNVNMR